MTTMQWSWDGFESYHMTPRLPVAYVSFRYLHQKLIVYHSNILSAIAKRMSD